MNLKHTIIALSTLVVTMIMVGYGYADDKLKYNLQPKPNLKPNITDQLGIAPDIRDVKHSCCGGSMSSAHLCVTATVVNKNAMAQTYTPEFTGMKAGECIEYNNDHCAGQPSDLLCVPKCTKQAPPAKIIVKAKPVSVPAHGQQSVTVVAPTYLYLEGTKIAIGGVNTNLPVPISQCVL